MKYIFTLFLISAGTVFQAASQEVVFEQEYTRNLMTPTDVVTIPLKDGGVFMAYCKSPKVSPKPSQVLTAFDKEKKKLFEFATADVVEFKNKKLDFLYNETNQKIYGIYTYEKKGAAFADIMMLNMAGSYTVKAGIPTPLHVMSCFIYNNDIVLVGLTAETKGSGLTSKIPSGSMEATIIKGDITSHSTQKLNMPSVTPNKNTIQSRMVGVDGSNLYFVTETKSEAITNTLALSYEFTQYDFSSHKVVNTKSVNIDLEGNSYRNASLQIASQAEFTHTDASREAMPAVMFQKSEKAFYVLGGFGSGYPADESLRKYEGSFAIQISNKFEVNWKSLIKNTAEINAIAALVDAKSKHVIGIQTLKGATYLTETCEEDGVFAGKVYNIENKSGKAGLVQATTEKADKLMFDRLYPDMAKNVSALQEKEGMASYAVQSGAMVYLVINNTSKNKIFIYRFN